MTLEDIKVSLDSNPNLSDEVRDNIYGLVHLFHEQYPDIALTNLCNHLKNLKMERVSKFASKRVSKYNAKTNTIEFNVEKINEGYDMKHVLMFELLNVATNNGEFTGFNKNDTYRALNAGFTEILANNLVGNDSDIPLYEDEVILVNEIGYKIGSDVLLDSYFNNDAVKLTNAMLNREMDAEYISLASNYNFDLIDRNNPISVKQNVTREIIKNSEDISKEDLDRISLFSSFDGETIHYKEEYDKKFVA